MDLSIAGWLLATLPVLFAFRRMLRSVNLTVIVLTTLVESLGKLRRAWDKAFGCKRKPAPARKTRRATGSAKANRKKRVTRVSRNRD